MYEGATRVHFIFAGTSKKSEMLYNVGGAIRFITVTKNKMYCMAVKSMASGLTFLQQKQHFLIPANTFNFLQL